MQVTFLTMTVEAPGGPENAGALGSEHSHAGILVKIFGGEFDFSAPASRLNGYQATQTFIYLSRKVTIGCLLLGEN
jgi:hypothetical protein